MSKPPLHPALSPLAELVGTFEGTGAGHYPTIEPFEYRERVTFGHVGKPVLAYEQATWDPVSGTPMHAERGFLRPAGEGRVEFGIAHVFGITELLEGDHDRTDDDRDRLRLTATSLGIAGTAKPVRHVRRELRFDAERLDYDVWMSYREVPETHHLAADLRRVA